MNKKVVDYLPIAFCLSIAIGMQIGKAMTYGFTIVWFLTALKWVKPVGNKNYLNLNKLFLAFSIMPFLIELYSLVLVLFGVEKMADFSLNLSTFFGIILAYTALVLFKKQALRIGFLIIFLSWFLVLGKGFLTQGFSVFSNAIAAGWLGKSGVNILESSELVLAAAYYWCIYLFMGKKEKKKTVILTILILFMILLGFKRITVLAVGASTILYILFKYLNKENKQKTLKALSIAGIVVCLLYLVFVFNSAFFNKFLLKFGIDSMARNIFYEYICSNAKFSLFFTGLGRGSVMALMRQQYDGYIYVHSDILKMYVEIGFLFFIIYLAYYFIGLTKYIEKTHGLNCSIAYFICITFTFVLYLTDNTESYYICVFIRTLIPMYLCLYWNYFTNANHKHIKKVNGIE